MDDCVFCKIARGEIPAKLIHEDEEFVAFPDINPQAPVHVLVIPRKHLADVRQAAAADPGLFGRAYTVLCHLAEKQGLEEGFRIVCNTGDRGGQTVKHLHFHLLGGRFMGWPPG